LPQVTENFIAWGIPFPHILTPFVSGVEFFGGLLLLVALFSRISAGALGITMIVAIRSAKWADVDSLQTLLGFDEFEYLALFLWIAIAGPGALSLDYLLQRIFGSTNARQVDGPAPSGLDKTRAKDFGQFEVQELPLTDHPLRRISCALRLAGRPLECRVPIYSKRGPPTLHTPVTRTCSSGLDGS
jgi:uncharacterized membrane protein YphA (DoxX/SURF4 family)